MKDFMKTREKAKGEDEKGGGGVDEESKLRKKVIKGNWNVVKARHAHTPPFRLSPCPFFFFLSSSALPAGLSWGSSPQ